jgi:Holliday junction resolvasome RuvABC endonuclease subunit
VSVPYIVGLDLSLTATGVWHDPEHEGYEGHTIRTSSDDQLEQRLGEIVTWIYDWVTSAADLVVIEDFVTRSPAASLLGMVHGAVRLELHTQNTPFVLVPPATLKKFATGKGNATKADMRMALYKRAGLDVADDNQVDAAWLHMLGMEALGRPVVDLPVAQRIAHEAIAWPLELDRFIP